MPDTLDRLSATIAARRTAKPGSSYVAALFAKGLPKIAQKLGEEAVETVIAAMAGDARSVTGEAADLLFHLLVLLEASGVPLEDVMAELDRREGVSGLDEKASRTIVPPMAPAPTMPPLVPDAPIAHGQEPDHRPRIRKG